MKLDKLSIKWRVLIYLTVFVAILLLLLWLFQIVFLEQFYKAIKMRSIQSTADSIARKLDDEDLQSQLNTLARQDYMCIRILNESGEDLYSADFLHDCSIHKLSTEDLSRLFEEARASGGTVRRLSQKDVFLFGKTLPDRTPKTTEVQERPPRQGPMVSMVYGKIVARQDGTSVMVLLNAVITPINTTVETLFTQFLCISVILLILSVYLTLFLSNSISKPIIKINQSAKQLAAGNYDTRFEGGGYLEIAELNQTLNYAAQELSKVEDLRRELIANVSHDLRTPLTMIIGYAEVMRDLPGENSPENLQIIIDEAARLTSLVNDILDISKLQSGNQTLTLSRFNFTQTVEDILSRYRKLIAHEGYQIHFAPAEQVWLEGDQGKLSQVVYNLLSNAVNYTGPDKLVAVVQSVRDGRVYLEVTDTGEGILPENLPYIWERYYKVDKTHKRAQVGTGLGLSIVKGVIQLHGGEYGVRSEPGQGSTFWFSLSLPETNGRPKL